jgi:hypothetical protein
MNNTTVSSSCEKISTDEYNAQMKETTKLELEKLNKQLQDKNDNHDSDSDSDSDNDSYSNNCDNYSYSDSDNSYDSDDSDKKSNKKSKTKSNKIKIKELQKNNKKLHSSIMIIKKIAKLKINKNETKLRYLKLDLSNSNQKIEKQNNLIKDLKINNSKNETKLFWNQIYLNVESVFLIYLFYTITISYY